MPLQKNGNGQYDKTQNGDEHENALETTLSDNKTEQEQSLSQENIEPVKKIRRSRRRATRTQNESSLELTLATPENFNNGGESTSKEEVSSLPGIGEGIQRKIRRRRVVASSAEENV
ncbi:hypothetical protein GGR08_000503 [Bartonella fuyuanensis]|uniref:Uncharacterized protein n=2 Tax=Bartonella fuyuanensis TaxID=1460968 RepID=A0A840DTC0_9HYPH|nr:hypothetical protein [Bartonella fuyuanensis]